MASESVINEKKQIVSQLKQRVQHSVAGVLVDYIGLTVAQDTKLRSDLRKAGVQYTVVKNTLLSIAVEDTDVKDLQATLKGPTALATHETDMTAAAKILTEFAKKNDKFSVKAGYVDGAVLSVEQVNSLAELPSKEELVAKTLYCFNYPIQGFATVLNATIQGLAIALSEIAKKQQ